MAKPSKLELQFMQYAKLLAPELEFHAEHEFLEERKFRFDFCLPQEKVAIELEGGVFRYGRHNRPQGFTNDCEKYNLAQVDDWIVLRFTSNMLNDDPDTCFEQIKQVQARQAQKRDALGEVWTILVKERKSKGKNKK